ncbi:MAG: hypothetical protein FD128_1856 [Hyphomonadaceae bacterium]|nr:MAG: hypothetical protein FD128_1856 [Hyphomonadaceae bacterium]
MKLFYTYDANNNRTSVYDDMQVARFTNSYSYDALNRMSGVTFNGGSATYTYDSLGRRTGVTFGNGTSAQYKYVRQEIGRSPGDFDPCRIDSDLDWMRHVFASGGGSTAAKKTGT